MTAITFPNSPSSGDTHTAGNGIVYTYDGEKWTSIGTNSAGTWTRSGAEVSLTTAGDDLNVDSGTLFVDASTNRVGVGTSTPAAPLSVDASAGVSTVCLFKSPSANAYVQLGNSTNDQGYIGYESSDLSFYTASTERMRIDSSGRLIIADTDADNAPSYANDLIIGNTTGNHGLTIVGASDHHGTINFSDGTGSDAEQGIIQYQHTGNWMRFYTNGSEAMRINSYGRLLVGTTTEGFADAADNFTIADSGNSGMTIRSGSSDVGSIYFSDATSGSGEYAGYIDYQHNGDFMRFATNGGAERMRIDGSGRLLLGLTSSIGGGALFQVQGSGNRKAHFHQPDTGSSVVQFTNTTTGTGTSDGFEIALNGSEEGQIWLYESNNIKFGTGNAERLRIDSSGRLLLNGGTDVRMEFGTTGTTGTNNRNHIRGDGSNLKYNTCSGGQHIFEQNGTERARILSGGGLTFNGDTAQANALDDYEEGTWTPVIRGSSSAGTASYSQQQARYTRVGRLVHIEVYISWTGHTGSGNLQIHGLPFTVNNASVYGGPAVNYWHNISLGNDASPHAIFQTNGTFVYFYKQTAGTASAINVSSTGSIIIGGSYTV